VSDPLADVLIMTADMDTSLQTWEYDFERLARAAREHIAAEIEAEAALVAGFGYPDVARCFYLAARTARGDIP